MSTSEQPVLDDDWYPYVVPHIVGKRVVEFGLGWGTDVLLEHAAQVKSVEIAPTDEWVRKVMGRHGNNPRWEGVWLLAGAWSDQLAALVRKHAEGFDVAFVDHFLHARPETVNALFGVVPIIIAHDTATAPHAYHWERLESPADYTRTDHLDGLGTTVWVRKE